MSRDSKISSQSNSNIKRYDWNYKIIHYLKKILFGQNRTGRMKPEYSGWNLGEISGTNQNFKLRKNYVVLSHFFNWYETLMLFWPKQNKINNAGLNPIHYQREIHFFL